MSAEYIVGQFLQIAILALVALFLPVLFTRIVTSFDTKAAEAQKSMSAEDRYQFQTLVQQVVRAAEQSGLKKLITDTGASKKAWAIQTLQIILDSRGIKGISVAEISSAIEAALLQGYHKAHDEALPVSVNYTLGKSTVSGNSDGSVTVTPDAQ